MPNMEAYQQEVMQALSNFQAQKQAYERKMQEIQSVMGSNNMYSQQQQQVQQQHQLNLQKLDPIHSQFLQVYSNTKEGAPLADKYQSMFMQWMIKNGHASRMEQETNKLKNQFEAQIPEAAELRNKLSLGAIEYAHNLAATISNAAAKKGTEVADVDSAK